MNYSKKKQLKQHGVYNDPGQPESLNILKQQSIKNVDEWEKQIWFWRSHLDIFIEDYFSTPDKPVKLFDIQKVVARNCGNCNEVKDVESRSLGKTYKMAWILSALSILWPNTPILIVSKTVRQAILTVKYIESLARSNPNLARELILPVRVSKDGATVRFKNGSEIEALAMNVDGSNLRGLRKKIILIDESAWVKTDVIQNVLMPILQFKREIYWKYKDSGFEDFESKLFEISSAYLKSCDFFNRFKNTLKDMKTNDVKKFACALNYEAGVRVGVIDRNFVEAQKRQMPLSNWEMEWNSKFIGEVEGAYFPYDLTEPCRILEHVELFQPKGSKSRYILSCDVATSAASYADNACICVLKISEKPDGTFHKYLVYMRTYHGYKLEMLAQEIRKTCVRFSNIEKVIIDANALGEGLISLLNAPYVDDEGKEHLPFVCDDMDVATKNVLAIIRAVKADNKMNGRMATATRIYLENKSLHLPMPSATIRREQENQGIELEGESKRTRASKAVLLEEAAIFVEADALQYEMSNIVARITASGNTTYDTSSQSQHKDRYSSLSMGLEYIFQLEEKNKAANNKNNTNRSWGLAMTW